MPILGTKKVRNLLLSKKTENSSVEQISQRAINKFIALIDEMANKIAEEAMKGNYFRLHPIDIQRGYDKYIKEKATFKVRLVSE